MNEEGDTPTVAEAVQSTPMVSLNDEIAPKTDNKKSVFQRVGSLIGGKKSKDKTVAAESEEDVVAQLAKELEETRRERDRFKAAYLESETERKERITKMDCEIKLKSSKIENLEANIKFEAMLKAKDMESLKKESDILNEKLQASRNDIDRYKNELNSNASRMTEMDYEIKSKSAEIDNLKVTQEKAEVEWKSLIAKMEIEVNSKAKEIEHLQKADAELKSAMNRMESDIKSKSEEIDNLKRKSEADAASSKLESDRLNAKLEANRAEFDRYKRDLDAKKSEMEIEINSKAKEIECRQKLEDVSKSRISQLEEEVKAANCKVEENIKVSGDVQRILEKVETNSGNVTRGFENVEKNLRSLLDRTNEITIRARITNISSLTQDGEYSKWTEFAGMYWRIKVFKSGPNLGIRLRNKYTHGWSGSVKAEFKLLSQNDQSIVKSLEVTDFVDDESLYCGPFSFIPFEEMLRGNAVRDDSIIFEVVIRVFPNNCDPTVD